MAGLQISGALAAYQNGFSLAESSKAKTVAETETEAADRDPMEDYVVTLSELAKEIRDGDNPFAKTLASATGKSQDSEDSDDSEDPVIRSLKQQIAQVKAEIEQLKQKNIDADTKKKHIALKQNQLAQLQAQLQQAQEEILDSQSSLSGNSFYTTGSLT